MTMHIRASRRRLGGLVRRLAAVSVLTAAVAGVSVPAMASTPQQSGTNGVDIPSGATLKSGTDVTIAGLKLSMQTDGNLVLRANNNLGGPDAFELWASHTWNHPGATATMQADGNFVVYDTHHKALWSTGTYFHPGAHFSVQNDRNLVVYDANNKAVWTSGTYHVKTPMEAGARIVNRLNSGDTLNGTRTRLVMQTDGNLVIYSRATGRSLWSTMTYYHPGAYFESGSADAHASVYPATGGRALWNSPNSNQGGAIALYQSDDNFAVYNQAGSLLWATYTNYSN